PCDGGLIIVLPSLCCCHYHCPHCPIVLLPLLPHHPHHPITPIVLLSCCPHCLIGHPLIVTAVLLPPLIVLVRLNFIVVPVVVIPIVVVIILSLSLLSLSSSSTLSFSSAPTIHP
ncbi:hypothetical protein L208DRAFT_1416411, partial [Tricholoma matsutake]